MKISYDHKLLNSLLLYLDNKILSDGQAFTNYSGHFYKTNTSQAGYYAYSTPFKNLVNDTNISGATVLSGIYLNGAFITPGTSGFHHFNHKEGTAYFTGQVPQNIPISGYYSIKQFPVQITDLPEFKLIFETKYDTNPKITQNLTGLNSDIVTAPIVWLKPAYSENKPFAFDGIDENSVQLRLTIISDNQFNKIGICNVLKDLNIQTFPLVTSTPFDWMGNYTGGLAYNYKSLPQDPNYNPLIWESKIIDIPLTTFQGLQNLTTNVAMVDMTISTIMRHPV